jgi:hypothetical protein
LLIQLVGEDENGNLTYDPVASDLRIELGVKYHVAVRVSCSAHTVTFRVRQIDRPDAPVLTSIATHDVRSGLDSGASSLVIGGIHQRAPAHHWDGQIEAARVVRGLLADGELSAEAARWPSEAVTLWRASDGPHDRLAWASAEKTNGPVDARRQALADLCHVLLNSNEFLYLH